MRHTRDMENLPWTPFLLTDPALGRDPRSVRRLVTRGTVRRVLRGVGVRGEVEDSLLVRAQAAALVLGPGQVVCDYSAAWLHGVDVGPGRPGRGPDVLDVASVAGRRATRRGDADGCRRTVAPDEVTRVHGVAVTTPLRTAADLACRWGRGDAMAALDAFARLHQVDAEAHRPMVARFAGRRGVTQYRELVARIDPRAESPRESWLRLTAHDHGFADLEPQVDTWVEGYGWARLDLADRRRRIALEYDGADVHGDERSQEDDEGRRAAMVREGWVFVVVRGGGFVEPGLSRWLGELRAAYDDRARDPGRRYARGEGAGRHPRRG